MANTKKRPGLVIAGIGCGCLGFILLLAAGIFLYAGWQGYQEAPKLVEVQNRSPQTEDPYQLQPDQEETLFQHGYPEAFTILFYEEEIAGGGFQTVRLESWDYYSLGTSLTFINGELTAEEPLDISGELELEPMPYFPEQFDAFMSLDEVINAAGLNTYAEIPLDDEFLESGSSYFAEGLAFGLKDGALMYVEALALVPIK